MQLLHPLIARVNFCLLAWVEVDTTFLEQLEVMLSALCERSTDNLLAFPVSYELGLVGMLFLFA